VPLRWKENAVVNVKLTDSLYSIAQMYQEPYVQFFNVSNATGKWDGIDLTSIPTFVFLGHDKFFSREHYVEKLKHVKPIKIIPPQYVIRTFPRNALIEPKLSKSGVYDSTEGKVIKDNLDPIKDESIIRKHEIANMQLRWSLKSRLIYFYETGEDIDLDKLYRFFPDEFIKYLEIFYKKFDTDEIDIDATMQAWKNHFNISK